MTFAGPSGVVMAAVLLPAPSPQDHPALRLQPAHLVEGVLLLGLLSLSSSFLLWEVGVFLVNPFSIRLVFHFLRGGNFRGSPLSQMYPKPRIFPRRVSVLSSPPRLHPPHPHPPLGATQLAVFMGEGPFWYRWEFFIGICDR